LAEISSINNKTSEYIALKFENDWLARYPHPERCIHDNGGEFTGAPLLQHMLVLNGIKDVTTTVKNPQANAICERLHQSISNSLRVMLKAHPPMNEFQAQNIVDTCFATASYAARTTIHSILRLSPGDGFFNMI
jgi:transposase InsO family protein